MQALTMLYIVLLPLFVICFIYIEKPERQQY